MSEEKKKVSDRLVWIDIETTGVEDYDIMLEIAVIVTDNDLNELGMLSSFIIDCHPDSLIRAGQPRTKHSDIPCWEQHFDSGLIDQLKEEFHRAENIDPTVGVVEDGIVKFLNKHGVYEGMEKRAPMCGSSIHFDRRFIRRHMLKVIDVLHYRNIDVSGIRECARRWSPQLEIPEIEVAHRAVDDLRNSIALLQLFRQSGFLGV